MRILAFETSCDETSVAVVESGFRVLSNVTQTHIEHAKFGGVVPELASRAHVRLIYPLTKIALKRAGIDLGEIEAVAFTKGPGLIGSLLVGVVFGKTVAQALSIPFLGINHLEGHLFSIFLSNPDLRPPVLYLLVSGGHTELIYMEDFLVYRYLGRTMDDAAGEAFDKGGKLLGLPYPSGPVIDKLAKQGNPHFYRFPRAKTPGYNFSFSGLKTALLYYLRKQEEKFIKSHLHDIAASYQEAIVDMLLEKTQRALEKFNPPALAVVGGVSLNSRLRKAFTEKFSGKTTLLFPLPEYCTDNAAMIGAAALIRLKHGEVSPITESAYPNLQLV